MFKIVLFVGFIFFSTAIFALSVFINPVILKLDNNQQILSFSVTNKSDAKVSFQLSAQKWSQKNGVDSTTSTNDIIITPPIVTVPTGAEQVVRVGLRNPVASNTEATYRIFLQQLPSDIQGYKKNALNVLLSFSLPLFVSPAHEYKKVGWGMQKIGNNKLRVRVVNSGNVHVVITHLALHDASGPIYFSPKLVGRILSGQSQEWILSLKKPLTSNRITVDATTDWDDRYRELNVVVPVS